MTRYLPGKAMQSPQSATTPKILTLLKSQNFPKFQLEVSQGINQSKHRQAHLTFND